MLVATSASLTSLDGTTGAPTWVRADKDLDDSNVIPLPATPFALVTWRTGFEVVDLNTGESKWSSRSLPIEASYAHVLVVERRMLLVYGKRGRHKSVLVAADPESGAVLWRQDTLFTAAPEPLVVNVVTGKEESRLWLGDRTPKYEVDAIDSIVFFKQGRRQIVAFRM